ncbi:MAG: SGNH/GDSL hydrolase family protein [Muribaculaceae bacterium]|nr:SGNH/GDSL hydrolase family protein [Muribaculaceae bacterium]
MIKNILAACFVATATLCGNINAQAPQKLKVSILGDSYSTFTGYMTPSENKVWYGTDGSHMHENDAHSVEDTWWWQLINNNGMELERNNSWSGTTVCYTGYNGKDIGKMSFVERCLDLGNPDVILVFGGTNDSWANSPIGTDYKERGDSALYSFRPAFACMIERMQKAYPNAKIFNITNTELKGEVPPSMAEICEAYGIPNVVLQYVDKQKGHPSKSGMRQISEQTWRAIAPYLLAK